MNYKIRLLEERDNAVIERIIRRCLIEYGADHEGTAWADPNLGRFSTIYNQEGSTDRYWVAEDEDGKVIAGVGIGKLEGAEDVCELQKMYCLPEHRGSGIASRLMTTALAHAGKYYGRCYLETLDNMTAAQRFYEKCGFHRTLENVVETEHFACDVHYVKDLNPKN